MRNYLRNIAIMMAMLLLCISVTNVVFAGNKDGRALEDTVVQNANWEKHYLKILIFH